MCTRNKVRKRERQRKRKTRDGREGRGQGIKKIKLSEFMTHQLIAEILFLSKEKTGLKHPIKERMKGNLLLLIKRAIF